MSPLLCSVVRHSNPMCLSRHWKQLVLVLIVLTTLGGSAARLTAVGNQAVYLPTVMTPAPAPYCGTPTEVSGLLTSATTWDPSRLYVVSGDVTVKPGATLTILPGTVVKFRAGRGILVEGKLTSVGTTANPVFLTSWNDDRTCGDTNEDGSASSPRPGDWSGIDFRQGSDPSSSLRWANIRYGGRWGNTWLAPIRIFNVTPTFEYLTIQNSFRNAVQLVGGDWTTQTLASTTVIYWIDQGEYGNLQVLRENTLTIQPGVKIKAASGHGIYVEGMLRADGATTNPIYFSSEKDDTLCGRGVSGESICDTNDDSTASAPVAGDWKWIEFSPGSSADSAIQNAVLRYGGRTGSAWRAPIRLDKVSPTLENLTIEHSHRNAAQLIGGGWTTQTLRSTTVVYWLYDDHLEVLADNTLKIMPGVKVKLQDDHAIHIGGKLDAEGSPTQPIVVTSFRDDTICGRGVNGEPICDTNDDGTASVPGAGNWAWIGFLPGSDSTSVMRYMVLRYGGRHHSAWRAPIRLDKVSPTLENLTIEHSHRNAAQLIGGGWTTQTLRSTTVVYWLYDDHLEVLADNTLKIMPGVKVKLQDDHAIHIGGKLDAEGTLTQPIVVTSFRDDTVCGRGVNDDLICDTNDDGTASVPGAGNWAWIGFLPGSDSTSVMRYMVLRYGGRHHSAWRAPIRLDKVSPTLENLTIEHSHRNAAQLIGGGWTTQMLRSKTVVYWIYDDHLYVLAANTMTILPGVKIKFPEGHGLIVRGKLLAEGTPSEPLIFTSERDDTVCGRGVNDEPICDTNNDAAASVPGQGNWLWIEFRPESDPASVLRNAVVSYGGRNHGDWRAALMIVNASPTIDRVLLDTNHGGIYFYENAAPSLGCNDLVGNQYGLHNTNPAHVVTAESQWWGHSSGPTHAGNPGGTGQTASNGIDYTPWRNTRCTDFIR